MKKLFKKKKKSASEAGSVADLSVSGYDISPKKDLGKLHRAAFEGDLTKLKALLKKSESKINDVDHEKRTPLHLSCANGKIDAVRMLTEQSKINIDVCDSSGRTAAMKCIQCQFHNCLDILIRKGADLSLADINGNTALHLAVSHTSTEITFLLLDHGVDVHYRNKDGNTPLHVAASVSGSEKIVRTLVNDGAAVDATNKSGKTALMIAASRGYVSVVKQLLESGANSTLEDSNGWTANDLANSNGHHPLSYIIVEHSMKRGSITGSVSGSRPSSANFHHSNHPQPSPVLPTRLSSAVSTPKRLQSPTPSITRVPIKNNLFDLSNIAGGPAMENEETTQDEEEESVASKQLSNNDKNDLWSVTDEDDNEEEDVKPAKVNVMAFLRNREQNKKLSSNESSPQTSTKPNQPNNHPTTTLPAVTTPKGNPRGEYLEKYIEEEESNSWSVTSSGSSEVGDSEVEEKSVENNPKKISDVKIGDMTSSATAKTPPVANKPSPVINKPSSKTSKPPDPRKVEVEAKVESSTPAEQKTPKKPAELETPSKSAPMKTKVKSTWDSTDDDSDDEGSPPNPYIPSIQRNLAAELGFDDDEVDIGKTSSEDSDSDENSIASPPQLQEQKVKVEDKPATKQQQKQGDISTSSDWDSDEEDEESQEHFHAAVDTNVLQGTSELKFDDEVSSSSSSESESSESDDPNEYKSETTVKVVKNPPFPQVVAGRTKTATPYNRRTGRTPYSRRNSNRSSGYSSYSRRSSGAGKPQPYVRKKPRKKPKSENQEANKEPTFKITPDMSLAERLAIKKQRVLEAKKTKLMRQVKRAQNTLEKIQTEENSSRDAVELYEEARHAINARRQNFRPNRPTEFTPARSNSSDLDKRMMDHLQNSADPQLLADIEAILIHNQAGPYQQNGQFVADLVSKAFSAIKQRTQAAGNYWKGKLRTNPEYNHDITISDTPPHHPQVPRKLSIRSFGGGRNDNNDYYQTTSEEDDMANPVQMKPRHLKRSQPHRGRDIADDSEYIPHHVERSSPHHTIPIHRIYRRDNREQKIEPPNNDKQHVNFVEEENSPIPTPRDKPMGYMHHRAMSPHEQPIPKNLKMSSPVDKSPRSDNLHDEPDTPIQTSPKGDNSRCHTFYAAKRNAVEHPSHDSRNNLEHTPPTPQQQSTSPRQHQNVDSPPLRHDPTTPTISHFMQEREELVASIRKLNFELAATKERQKTYDLELTTEREASFKMNEDLQIERNVRRKLEVTIRDLKHELHSMKQTINVLEEDRERLQNELSQEIRQKEVRNKIESMNDRVEQQTSRKWF